MSFCLPFLWGRRSKAKQRPKSSSQTSPVQPLPSGPESPSPAVQQHGGTDISASIPNVSSGPRVQPSDAGQSLVPVAVASTQEQAIPAAPSSSVAENVYSGAKVIFRIAAGAAELNPVAKAVVAGLTEILKVVDVSFQHLIALAIYSVTKPHIDCPDRT